MYSLVTIQAVRGHRLLIGLVRTRRAISALAFFTLLICFPSAGDAEAAASTVNCKRAMRCSMTFMTVECQESRIEITMEELIYQETCLLLV